MSCPKILSLLLLMGAVFTAPRAFPISRVGNSVIADPELGFQAQIPPNFFDVRRLSQDGIRLSTSVPGMMFLGSFVPTNASLDLYPLASEYPDLPDAGRDEALAYFRGRGAAWTEISIHESCILALTAVNEGTTTTVIAWGERKGIVIIGAPQARVEAALTQLVDSLRLDGGQCAWR